MCLKTKGLPIVFNRFKDNTETRATGIDIKKRARSETGPQSGELW